MPDLNHLKKVLSASTSYDDILAYLSELSRFVADVRNNIGENMSAEARLGMAKLVDNHIAEIRRLRNNRQQKPPSSDEQGFN